MRHQTISILRWLILLPALYFVMGWVPRCGFYVFGMANSLLSLSPLFRYDSALTHVVATAISFFNYAIITACSGALAPQFKRPVVVAFALHVVAFRGFAMFHLLPILSNENIPGYEEGTSFLFKLVTASPVAQITGSVLAAFLILRRPQLVSVLPRTTAADRDHAP